MLYECFSQPKIKFARNHFAKVFWFENLKFHVRSVFKAMKINEIFSVKLLWEKIRNKQFEKNYDCIDWKACQISVKGNYL